MAKSIFISYARADGEQFAESLYKELSDRGHDVWWDREKLRSRGVGFLQEIRDAITKIDRVLLVVTPGAIESQYVKYEWEYALSICTVVIPLLRIGKGNQNNDEDYGLIPKQISNNNAIDFRLPRPHYDSMQDLSRDLKIEDKPLGYPTTVPELPTQYLLRGAPIQAVKDTLLADVQSTTAISGKSRSGGIQGMSGIGKSVLAIAIARDCDVRRRFPDGIFWLRIGQNPQLEIIQANLGEGLGGNPRNFVSVNEGKRILSQLLKDKQCLIVLDDVWKPEHADAFAVANEHSKLLITTRIATVTHAMGVTPYELDLLSDEQARELLAIWAGITVENLSEEADEVIQECGNLPLGIALIGAMIAKNPNSWKRALYRLKNADLDKIRNDFPEYPYPDLMKALHVSVEDLPENTQKRYIDFAVFQDGVSIPPNVIKTFWKPLGLDQYDTEDILDELVSRSLLKRDDAGNLTLHDLQADYVRKQAGDDLKNLHQQLLGAYNPDGKPWYEIKHDGYLYFQLAHHLIQAEQPETLHNLLTSSNHWLQVKAVVCKGDTSYVNDLRLAMIDYNDPLTFKQFLELLKIYTCRQVVNHRVGRYNDDMLEAMIWLGKSVEARSFAYLRPEPKERYKSVLAVYAAMMKKGEIEQLPIEDLIIIIRSIASSRDRSEALSSLASDLAYADHPDAQHIFQQAETIANNISDDRDRSEALSSLASDLAYADHPDAQHIFQQAETIANNISDDRDRSEALTSLAKALSLADHPNAHHIFQQAETSANNISQGFYRSEALTSLAKALIQVGHFQQAETIANNISHGFSRSGVLSFLAYALSRADHPDAQRIFQQAETIANNISYDFYDSIALAGIVLHLAQAGHFQQAETIANNISHGFSRSLALSHLASALAQAGHFEQAKTFVDKIIDHFPRSEALSSLASALAQANHPDTQRIFQQAETIATTFHERFRHPQALIALITFLAQAGHFQQAETLTNSITNDFYRSEALSSLASALAQANHPDTQRIFQQAETLINSITDDSSRSKKLSNLASVLAQTNHPDTQRIFQQAETLAITLTPNYERSYVFSSLSQVLAKIGQFRQAEIIANNISEDFYRLRALLSLFQANHPDAQRIFQQAETIANNISEDFYRSEAFLSLSQVLAKIGQFRQAEIIANNIPNDRYRVSALSSLANCLTQAKHPNVQRILEEAETVANNISHEISRSRAFQDLATALAKNGQLSDAISLLGVFDMDELVQYFCEWESGLEDSYASEVKDPFRKALLAMLKIIGWERKDWLEIAEILE